MGAVASIARDLDQDDCKNILADRFDAEIFEKYKNSDGLINPTVMKKLVEFYSGFDCFFSFDVERDEFGRSNEERVLRIESFLKSKGLHTKFNVKGGSNFSSSDDIIRSQCFIVFITKKYVDKLFSNNFDVCKIEYQNAVRLKTSRFIVPVVMENRMRNSGSWIGGIGMTLGGMQYADFVHDNDWEEQCERLYYRIINLIIPLRQQMLDNADSIIASAMNNNNDKNNDDNNNEDDNNNNDIKENESRKEEETVENNEDIAEDIIESNSSSRNIYNEESSFRSSNNNKKKSSNTAVKTIIKYDAYLSFDYGMDEYGRENYERVHKINDELTKLGLTTHLATGSHDNNNDDDSRDNVYNQANCFVVFITDQYMKHVNSNNIKNRIKQEYKYAFQNLGPNKIIPIVMENKMRNTKNWIGEFGGSLGGMLYMDLVEDETVSFMLTCEKLVKRIALIGKIITMNEHGEYIIKDENEEVMGETSKLINKLEVRQADTDVFLTHDWGINENGVSNHEVVKLVNKKLKELGIITWFDEEKLSGNVLSQMTSGIDSTKCLIVFVTQRYMNKVNGNDGRDNCKVEFEYAFRQLGNHKIIPVVMEERMLNHIHWKGVFGGAIGSIESIDFTSIATNDFISSYNNNSDEDNYNNNVFKELCEKIKSAVQKILEFV